jgi:cysteine desulfurase
MNGTAAVRPVYLDHAATTPVAREVIEVMTDCLADPVRFANPSSQHLAGRAAAAVERKARTELANLLNVAPRDLIWTSGATEADNLAIIGGARFRAHRGKHLVSNRCEHKAVLDAFQALEKEGFEVTWLTPRADGLLDVDELQAALRDDTQLVSVMHVNNETGVVQDIGSIGRLCRERGILFHCDAAQSVGKLPLDLQRLPVDLLSLTAHKFHGPAGIGALYIAPRPGCGVQPLFHGGGQQRRLRPGTLPTHLVAGCGAAAALAARHMDVDLVHLQQLYDRLWEGVRHLPGLHLNGNAKRHFPGILNVSVDDIEGESLRLALEPLCVAAGSACNAESGEPSYVLRALGRSNALAQSAVRFSFGRDTSSADIDFAIATYISAVQRLRALAPVAAGP